MKFPITFDEMMNTDPKISIPIYTQQAVEKVIQENKFVITLPDFEAENAITSVQLFMVATSLRYDPELPHLKELALEEMAGQAAKSIMKLPNDDISFFFDLYEAIESLVLLMSFGFVESGDVFELLGASEYKPENYEDPQLIEFSVEELMEDINEDAGDVWNRLKGE